LYSPYGELEAVVAAHPFDYGERSERLSVADRIGRESEQGRERQTLRPARRTRTGSFAPGGDDGDVDADDYAVTTNGTCSGTATGDCRRLDANADGVVNSTDRTAIAAYLATLDSDTELQRVPAATHSRRGNLFAHQGLLLDPEIGSYQNRARQYTPGAKRFMQVDQLSRLNSAGSGMHDGVDLYAYNLLNPVHNIDPSGTFAYYGNWCGPNWSGGCTGWGCQTPPIDELDSACMDHDLCYRKNKCSYEWLWPGQAQMSCDIELCRDLQKLLNGSPCALVNQPPSTVNMCDRAQQMWSAFYCSWYPI